MIMVYHWLTICDCMEKKQKSLKKTGMGNWKTIILQSNKVFNGEQVMRDGWVVGGRVFFFFYHMGICHYFYNF